MNPAEIIERVKSAIAHVEPHAVYFQAQAAILATLDAIREPSEAMQEAADALIIPSGTMSGCYHDFRPDPDEAWRAMIDALKREVAG